MLSIPTPHASGAGLGGPVSDPVMQVTLSNSGANMTAKQSGITHSHVHSAIFLHSTICMCSVQVWTCVSYNMGTHIQWVLNMVIQKIWITTYSI